MQLVFYMSIPSFMLPCKDLTFEERRAVRAAAAAFFMLNESRYIVAPS